MAASTSLWRVLQRRGVGGRLWSSLPSQRALHASSCLTKAAASSSHSPPPEEFNEVVALPWGEHPDKPRSPDMELRCRVFILGWAAFFGVFLYKIFVMDKPTMNKWAYEEALYREAEARIAAREARERASMGGGVAEDRFTGS